MRIPTRSRPALTDASERRVAVRVSGAIWFATTAIVVGLSFIHGLAPPHVNAWRIGLGAPSLLFAIAILTVGPRLGRTGFKRGAAVVHVTAGTMYCTLLLITPATFAVLMALNLNSLAASYLFSRRAVLLDLFAMTAVGLSTLVLALPGGEQARAPSWLAVFLPTFWVVTVVMSFRGSAVRHALAAAREQSLTDPLTGLGNLRRLHAAAEDAHLGTSGGLLLVDLDNFKLTNTLHGHGGGDLALRVVADALRAATDPRDTVARVGGDEIAVLAPRASAERLAVLAQTYRDAVRKAGTELGLSGVRLDASVGIAVCPYDGTTLSELLTAADRSMYAVKATRPNRREAIATLPGAVAREGAQRSGAGRGEDLERRRGASRLAAAPARAPRPAPGTRRCARGPAVAYHQLVAALIGIASASLMMSLLLRGADTAHAEAIVAFALGGLALCATIVLAAPRRLTRSRPLAEAASVGLLMLLLSLTGGAMSQAIPLVLMLALLLSLARPVRPLALRLLLPALVVLSPLAYQDILAGGEGPTAVALLCAALAVASVLTLTMHSSEKVLGLLKERSRRHAVTDPLTGLSNRRAFETALWEAIAGGAAASPDDRFAVVMIDLDDFAAVNNLLGHAAGDAVLRDIAAALRDVARHDDCLARIGGDEFAVILPGAGEHEAQALAARFVAAVADRTSRSANATQAGVGASAGCALYPADGRTLDELVGRADEALMEVKRSRKGAVGVGPAAQAS